MKININYRKMGWISLVSIIFSLVNGYFMFPKILKFMLKRVSFLLHSTSFQIGKSFVCKNLFSIFSSTKNLQLRPGSQMRPLFENIPFPLIFKVHVFNITNSIDVINGSKPIVKDIGPYVFEWVSTSIVSYDLGI